MISEELRKLIVAQLDAGRPTCEIVKIFQDSVKTTTVFNIAKDYANGAKKKVPKVVKHPPKKVSSKMAAKMIRLLTVAKKHHSYNSVARLLELNESTVRYHMKKHKINCYKKVKRNLVPQTQQETRRFCCMNFRKTYRTSDIPKFLFVDESYIIVKKHFNHQNERCYGKNFRFVRTWKKFRQFPKTPLSAMIFAGVFRDGRTKLVVFKSGFRIHQQFYKDECLIPVLKGLPSEMDKKEIVFY